MPILKSKHYSKVSDYSDKDQDLCYFSFWVIIATKELSLMFISPQEKGCVSTFFVE